VTGAGTINGVRFDQALQCPTRGGDAGKLCVPGPCAELLGVEVDPRSVGGILRAVDVPCPRRQVAGLAPRSRNHREPAGRREVTAWQIDEGQCGAIRADSMEEVVTSGVVANPGRPAAADRSHVEVPVIGGEVDQPALRVEDVVVC
jgi:hypothetical protein